LQSTNDLEVYTPKVIVIAAFTCTWPVSGLLLQCLYLSRFLRYYHFWSECDWQQKLKLQVTCTRQFMCK